ncbi:MAG: hypothetical protein RIC95_10405 [Vicingaceae bacterium]
MKFLYILLSSFLIPITIIGQSKIDSLYQTPTDPEVFYYNGYEAPENVKPDFVIESNNVKKQEFVIDKNCETDMPASCISLYHFPVENGHKWMIKTSRILKNPITINYGQRVGESGEVVTSKVTLRPDTVRDMGYGVYKQSKKRDVWIISASIDQ